MKIGIFGGSFNPIHKGHEEIAKLSIKELNLDKLIIVPVGVASHKKNNFLEAKLRFELCQKVFEDFKNIEVSDIEIKNSETSYTYKTLQEIIELYGKEHEYFEIIGEDSIDYFEKWKNYKEILEKSKVVVFRRKNSKREYKHLKHKNIIYLESPYYNISSTEIREKIKNKESLENLLNKKIIKFFINLKNYGGLKNE